MKFQFRLAYYLAGFCIGLVFVFFILNGKEASCSYFPNARVLKNLRSKPFIYSSEAEAKMGGKLIDSADFRAILTKGDVDFEISNKPERGGKLYVIYGRNSKNQEVALEVINYEDKAVLKDIRLREKL